MLQHICRVHAALFRFIFIFIFGTALSCQRANTLVAAFFQRLRINSEKYHMKNTQKPVSEKKTSEARNKNTPQNLSHRSQPHILFLCRMAPSHAVKRHLEKETIQQKRSPSNLLFLLPTSRTHAPNHCHLTNVSGAWATRSAVPTRTSKHTGRNKKETERISKWICVHSASTAT